MALNWSICINIITWDSCKFMLDIIINNFFDSYMTLSNIGLVKFDLWGRTGKNSYKPKGFFLILYSRLKKMIIHLLEKLKSWLYHLINAKLIFL